ncbi:hypothetical protein SpCBS45565_g02530 [Spizellomyces sp. 'palustris']|nr:hypothetical protein SpCBS45565_g02530 [Spizellomyces sp. 'palustris']
MPAIQLGFAEVPEERLTYSLDDYPNKIGGKPFWLNPSKYLSCADVLCSVCNKVMVLLVQFYTPEDEPPEAYHRVIYLFCCRDGKCHKTDWKGCFKVYRSQLGEWNPYYNPGDGMQVDSFQASQCTVCGLEAPKTCSKCKKVHYCCREHQLVDWTGGHKAICGTDKNSTTSTTHLFPEFELVSEDEPEAEPVTTPIPTLPLPTPDTTSEQHQEEYEETSVDVDKPFLKFQKRISRSPSQVIRYARVSYSLDPTPLYVASTLPPPIPPCPYCNQPRTFEFQLMPQMLNVLDINHYEEHALDWGTVIVYSCAGNCWGEEVFREEVVWRQMFSEEGMGDAARRALEGKA